jgi:hypothetical protein
MFENRSTFDFAARQTSLVAGNEIDGSFPHSAEMTFEDCSPRRRRRDRAFDRENKESVYPIERPLNPDAMDRLWHRFF